MRCTGVGVQRCAVQRDRDLVLSIASSSLMYCSCLPFFTLYTAAERCRRDRVQRFPASDDREGQQQRTNVRAVDVRIGHDEML